MQRVFAWANIGDGESAIRGTLRPELVVVAVVRPGDDVAISRQQRISGYRPLEVRMS